MDSTSLIKYPIYIVSKGRATSALTANFLKKYGLDFRIAVEPQEYEEYCFSIGSKYVLELPFSNLGLGSYPARNYCWEDSIKRGFEAHYLFDDNIRGFWRLNNGKREKTGQTVLAFLTLQNLFDRYKNLSIAGFNYLYFATKETKNPFSINTHVYSGMLIKNSIFSRWRLKYNEDVDLCLQELDKGECTILLNAFLIDKVSTVVKMKGGNQTELYKNNDERKKILKARSLEEVWPNYAKTVIRFNRPHHHVSWNKHFTHPLIKKKNYEEIIKEQAIEMNGLVESLNA